MDAPLTFVIEPASPVLAPSLVRRSGRWRRFARRSFDTALRPVRSGTTAIRRGAAALRRGAQTSTAWGRRGMLGVLSLIAALGRLLIALVLLPWRAAVAIVTGGVHLLRATARAVATGAVALIRATGDAAVMSARACRRLAYAATAAIASAIRRSVMAVIGAAVNLVRLTRQATIAFVHRIVDVSVAQYEAVLAFASAVARYVTAAGVTVSTHVRGAVRRAGRTVVVVLSAGITLLTTGIDAVYAGVRRLAHAVAQRLLAALRWLRAAAAAILYVIVRIASAAFGVIGDVITTLLATILTACRVAITAGIGVLVTLRRVVALLPAAIAMSSRASLHAGRRARLILLALATSLRVLAIRAAAATVSAAHATLAGCKHLLTSFRSALSAVDEAAAAQGRRLGTAARTKSHAMHSSVAQVHRRVSHSTGEAVRASTAFERKVIGAASHGREIAGRGAHNALVALHGAEASLFAGVLRFCRDASAEMAHTVVVLRVPTTLGTVPHVGRGWLLATAGGMIVLALAASLSRFPAVTPRWSELLVRRDAPAPPGAAVGRTRMPADAVPFVRGQALAIVAPLRPAVRPLTAANVRAIAASHPGDSRAIQAVLNQYRDALSVLNVAGVRDVWPTARPEIVQAGFAGLVEQNVEFERCRISPAGTRATAACAGVVESGFSAGRRRPKVARTRWEFRLQKTGSRWTITAVDVLPG